MKLEEIKKAVENGKRVFWKGENYEIVKGEAGFLISCTHNDFAIALTHADGVTMNGNESDFFVEGEKPEPETEQPARVPLSHIPQDTRDFLEAVLWVERFQDEGGEREPENDPPSFSDEGFSVDDFHPDFIRAVSGFLTNVYDGFVDDWNRETDLNACARSFGGNVFFSLSGHGCGFFDEREADGDALEKELEEMLFDSYRFENLDLWVDPETGLIDFCVTESARAETYHDKFFVLTEGRKYDLREHLEKMLESAEEYETGHVDAGNNYCHLVREGDWIYKNGETRLKEYLTKHEIETHPALDFDSLFDGLEMDVEPHPTHIFETPNPQGFFDMASFPVGEIETQIDFDSFARVAGCGGAETRAFFKGEIERGFFCLRENGSGSVLAYINTDAFWTFRIEDETLRVLIEQENESARDREEYKRGKGDA